MNKSLWVIIFIFNIHICLYAQVNVDFFPKMLQKDLNDLGITNIMTKEVEIPVKHKTALSNGKFYSISSPSETVNSGFYYIGRVKTCRAGGCSINKDLDPNGDSEFFDYYILFNTNCSIRSVRIYNYQATHGHEVTSKSWLTQFKGYKGEKELTVNKNVDAISGATISVYAITADVEHKTSLLRQILHDI